MTRDKFSLGAVLVAARKHKMMTQAEVAERLGVSKPSVWAWENNRANPTDDKLEALSEVLAVPLENLRVQRFVTQEAVIERCRNEIAASLAVRPECVKISLEL